MPSPLHKTRGIILRTIKYGESSVVVTVFTELFGIQSYIVNSVRTASKKSTGKSQLFQPAALLDLVIYHNEQRQLNRIKEYTWAFIYSEIFSDVPKNAVALFIVELLHRSLKQPEGNPDLFQFTEDVLLKLDESKGTVMANLPVFFALHLSHFLGFRFDDNSDDHRTYLDLKEGCFLDHIPEHPYFLDEKQSQVVGQFLKVLQPEELEGIKLNAEFRRNLLQKLETYYAIHIPEFGALKTLPVLKSIF